jgi:hypothetical protein
VNDAAQRGIIPRLVDELFATIAGADETRKVQIQLSYFEIYNETLIDLLNSTCVFVCCLLIHLSSATSKSITIREKRGVPFVAGVTKRYATSTDDILHAIAEGNLNRSVATTSTFLLF